MSIALFSVKYLWKGYSKWNKDIVGNSNRGAFEHSSINGMLKWAHARSYNYFLYIYKLWICRVDNL